MTLSTSFYSPLAQPVFQLVAISCLPTPKCWGYKYILLHPVTVHVFKRKIFIILVTHILYHIIIYIVKNHQHKAPKLQKEGTVPIKWPVTFAFSAWKVQVVSWQAYVINHFWKPENISQTCEKKREENWLSSMSASTNHQFAIHTPSLEAVFCFVLNPQCQEVFKYQNKPPSIN